MSRGCCVNNFAVGRSEIQAVEAFTQPSSTNRRRNRRFFKTASSEEMKARAARLLQKAIVLDPSLAEPHFYLGTFALDRGAVQEALPYLETGVKLAPRSSRMHFALSRALKRTGRLAESDGEYAIFTKLKFEEEQAESR